MAQTTDPSPASDARHKPSATPSPPPTPSIAKPTADAPAASPEARRPILSRRRFLSAAGLLGAAGLGLGAYAHFVEPFWPEFHERAMPIPGLDPALEGFRITHLTDLHVSNAASIPYLTAVIDRVNALRPDLVVVTGDLVTQPTPRAADAIELLGRLRVPAAISFGNHDCGIFHKNLNQPDLDLLDRLDRGLSAHPDFMVLRNRATPIRRGTGTLWVVGLEEVWSGFFDARMAFRDVPAGEPCIALSHNPDTVPMLMRYAPSWIFAGHTHGGQVCMPLYGAIILPIANRRWGAGEAQVGRSRLYVSRGVGYLHQLRFYCRPEVPTFSLTRGV